MKQEITLVPSQFDLHGFDQHCTYSGTDFFLTSWLDDTERLCREIMDDGIQYDHVFKHSRRRNVFSIRNFLVKKYVFNHLSDILHSNRYAQREFSCYLHYRKAFGEVAGMRLPELYGFFIRKTLFFFSSINGIITEYIPDTRFLSGDELPLAAPLFVNHYRKGIYHPDIQYLNLLIQDGSRTLFPIDYIGCNFFEQPNVDSLFLQLARFCQTAETSAENQRRLLEATLAGLPELNLKMDASWEVLSSLTARHLTTHQEGHVLQLPAELKRTLQN